MSMVTHANAALIADVLREEAERLEPYYVIDQQNRRKIRYRRVHNHQTRTALYDRARQILEEFE